jgi:hypothetical protein
MPHLQPSAGAGRACIAAQDRREPDPDCFVTSRFVNIPVFGEN